MAAPLDGLRVIDASTGIAGPMAGMLLADFGADVVKVEPPGGEAGRANPGFAMWNRNKRGVVVDVESAADRDWLEGRLAGADLCIFSAPTEHLASNGLDPAAVTGRYGGLVYLHTPPFGSTTPWAGGQESAALAHAALGVGVRQYGVADVPIDCVYPHVLYGQAIMAATSAVAALLERSASGRGQTVTVGALHGTILTMAGMMTHEVGVETVQPAGGTGGPMPFYHLYECGDGQWLFQAGLKPAFYYAAFDVLGVMDILSDERLGGEPAAMALPGQAPWVIERIQAAYRAKPRAEWLRILEEVGCPAGPVADRDVWLDHPQIEAIGMRVEVDDPERGRVVMPGLPLNLMASPASVRRAAPSVGQDDGEVEAWEAKPVPGGALSGAVAPSGKAAVGDGPLAGRRILDLGSIIAGTYPGSLLAELGADVIKVESLDGDVVRSFGPTFVGYNKGKRSVSIDLRSEAGLATFYALVKTVDVVIDNYRPGVLQTLKIHYDDLVQVNPAIIAVSVTGFGEAGPMRDDSGFDPLVQALSGMMQAQGGGEDPVFYAMPVNDVSSAAIAALGACLAMVHRDRTGEGQRVWTSLAAMGAMMQSGELVRYAGRPAAPVGGKDFAGPSPLNRYYRSSDGWVRLQATAKEDGPRLQEAGFLDIPTVKGQGLEDLDKWLSGVFAGMTSAEAVERLTAVGVPAAVARSLEELSRDDSLAEADVVHLHQPEQGVEFYSAGRFARLSRTEKSGVLDPPGLGEHSREVLAEAGFGGAEIEALINDGVVVAGEPFALWGGRSI